MTTQTLGKGEMDAWGQRAQQVKLLGLNRASAAEIGAVHAGLYPSAEAVRITCRKCVSDAFQAILRYLRTQSDTSPTTSILPQTAMKQALTYRFADDKQTYRPHNSPTVYNNANLTDERVRTILKADPAAAAHFGISEEEGQAFVDAGTQPEPTAEELRAEQFKQLDAITRVELDKLYVQEVPESDPKNFAKKEDLINSLLDFRAKA
ncbi:hypothetical protein [Hymenobacter pini]|uniref:hypothetical protein n=1 Tax=Hymenobacter pini TaxID=2880879 RepID=UPI001CF4F584|nr:hypothetical protein [Hymenobacter pini]MCA8830280.1 hypothetical protein [Hymenobacter pini]